MRDLDFDVELREFMKMRGFVDEVVHVDKLSNDDFAKIRHNWFGASDSSKLLGVNPYDRGKASELLEDKVNEYSDPSIGELASVRCGSDLEPLILDKATDFLGTIVYKPTIMYTNHITGQATNFDGVIVQDGQYIPVEAKYCSQFGYKHYNYDYAFSEEGHEHNTCEVVPVTKSKYQPIHEYIIEKAKSYGVPAYYYTQLQQQIDFLDADYGYLAVQNQRDWRFYIFKILKDDEVIRELRKEAQSYYGLLRAKKGLDNNENDGEDI